MACDRPDYTAIAAAFDTPIGSIGPTRMRALKMTKHPPGNLELRIP